MVPALKDSSISSPKASTQSVTRALEEWCATLAPGTRIPTRTELMRLFNASERAVLAALDDLRRNGYISTRQGSGTFVAARSGVTKPTLETTLVAVATPDHSFYDRALEVLLLQSEDRNLSLVCRPFVPREGVWPVLEDAAGYVLFGRRLAPLATRLHSEGKRVVLVATPAADEVFAVPSVRGDQQRGGYLVARHLIELGHRHLAAIASGNAENLRSPRIVGHQKAIEEAARNNVSVRLSFITPEQLQGWKGDVAQARRFWEQAEAPTAVAVWNDHDAVIFLGFLNYLGVRVPEQVSIVGYDNLPLSEQCHPSLTTVEGNLEAQLQAALDLLTQEQTPPTYQTIVVLPTLVERGSSAPCKPPS